MEFVNLGGWKPTLILADVVTLLFWQVLCELLDSISRQQLFLMFLFTGTMIPPTFPTPPPHEQDSQFFNLDVFYS